MSFIAMLLKVLYHFTFMEWLLFIGGLIMIFLVLGWIIYEHQNTPRR